MLWGQIQFQDSNSLIMENMIFFHDYVMIIIIMIMMMIFYMIMFMFLNKFINRNMLSGHFLEIIWTILPIILLIFIVMPSLKILYMSDEMNFPYFNIKVLGHQWYWSYELSDYNFIEFDSFMVKSNTFRLLEVDNRLILPYIFQIRFFITSNDVIHSFTMPTMGIKVDAIPGRLNQVSMMLMRPGLFYGQCSEICGINHSFMPIVIESTNIKNFLMWLKKF